MSTLLRRVSAIAFAYSMVASVYFIIEKAPSETVIRDCHFCRTYYQRGLNAAFVPVIFGGTGGSIMALAIAKKRKRDENSELK